MPRTARVFIENACYHIIVRGNQKQAVFKEYADYEYYLGLIHKYKLRYGCLLYSWCLMNNHVHLVLESPIKPRNISSFMHGLNQSYAMKFNAKYNKSGHLWQNRYKIFVVLKNDYILNLISYIEYNPVRAKIVLNPEDYQYSSYKYRLLDKRNIILDPLNL
jgi:putative transposase